MCILSTRSCRAKIYEWGTTQREHDVAFSSTSAEIVCACSVPCIEREVLLAAKGGHWIGFCLQGANWVLLIGYLGWQKQLWRHSSKFASGNTWYRIIVVFPTIMNLRSYSPAINPSPPYQGNLSHPWTEGFLGSAWFTEDIKWHLRMLLAWISPSPPSNPILAEGSQDLSEHSSVTGIPGCWRITSQTPCDLSAR